MSFDFMKKSIDELAKDLQEKKRQRDLIPTNWKEMQDADQPELTEMEKERFFKWYEAVKEMKEVRLLQIKQDNQEPIEEESEERQYGITRADTL